MVSFKSAPKTLAVYDAASIDTLAALDVPIAGIPQNFSLDYLETVVKAAKPIGSLFDPDFQALSQLKPDLIIVGGRSAKAFDSVAKVATAIDMTIPRDDLMAQTKAHTLAYGQLFAKTEAANALIAKLDTAIQQARKAAAGKGTGLVILTNGTKVSAYGPGSRFGWIYSALGMEPATKDIKSGNHGDAASFEFLLKVDPEWLLVIDRGSAINAEGSSAKETLDNELMHKTKAWKNNQIIYLNSKEVYITSGGIQAQTHIMQDLTQAFGKADPQ